MKRPSNKNILLILSLFLIFMIIGTATAADDSVSETNDEVLTVDNSTVSEDIVSTGTVDEGQVSSGESEVLSDASAGTFTELNDLIENANENSTINLDRNYSFNNDDVNKIIINKTLIIDGKNLFINANNGDFAMQINSSGVILKNINFVDFKNPIQWNGINGSLFNSNFDKTRIDWGGFNGTINYCNFTNSANSIMGSNLKIMNINAKYCDQPIYIYSNVTILNSNFTNNIANRDVGGVIRAGRDSNIIGCNFRNNKLTFNSNSWGRGGAIVASDDNVFIFNSIFENNTAQQTGGAIYSIAFNTTVLNCTFRDNKAPEGAAISSRSQATGFSIKDCIFNDTANGTSAITLSGISSQISFCNFTNNNASDIIKITNNGCLVDNCIFKDNTANSTVYSQIPISLVNNTYDSSPNTPYSLINKDFYISPTGTGDGSINNLANWTYAFTNIASDYTIYLTEGVYEFANINIYKSINIFGLGNVIIDLKNQHRAFNINAPNIVINNITFTNGLCTVDGGSAILFQDLGKNGAIYNCKFINNSAINCSAAIYTQSYFKLFNSTFINNTGEKYNDFIPSYEIKLGNNVFIGSYISIKNTISKVNPSFPVYVYDNKDMNYTLYINGNPVDNGTIYAFTSGQVTLKDLVVGDYYDVNISFVASELNNTYINNVVKTFQFVDKVIYYVSPNGDGDGSTINNPCSLDYAVKFAMSGNLIYLLSGTYIIDKSYDFICEVIGHGSIFDANNTQVILNLNNAFISNITFCNYKSDHHNANDAFLMGNGNSVISNCTFKNIINSYTSSHRNSAAPGIYLGGNNNTIVNCNFADCYNYLFSGAKGGVVYISGINNTIINSNFTKCYAYATNTFQSQITAGGAIYMTGSNNCITACNFNGCIARSNKDNLAYGGAIYIVGNNTVSHSSFIDNTVISNVGTTTNAIYVDNGAIASYNWYGNNDIVLSDFQNIGSSFLEVKVVKVYDDLVSGEWNGALDIYFVKNGTNERVNIKSLRPATLTLISGDAKVKNTTVGKHGKIYTDNVDQEIKVQVQVDDFISEVFTFGATNNTGFTELQNLIKGADEGETLAINNNYTYNPEKDGELINGIIIDKEITIDLNGSTIDGNGTAEGVFNITSDNVDLENINIENVNGSAIISTGDNISINNLTANNVTGTVIDITGDGASISDVELNNSTGIKINGTGANISDVEVNGGNGVVIDVTGDGAVIETVNVTDHVGDVISVEGNNTEITGVETTNNNDGIIIDVNGDNTNITDTTVNGGDSTVINVAGNQTTVDTVNVTDHSGTVIKVDGDNTTVGDVETTNNNDGIIIDVNGDNINIRDIAVNGGNSTVIDVTGNNTNIDTVSVTGHSGDVIKVEGDDAVISDVEATNNTDGTVVDVAGDSAQIIDTTVNGGNSTVIDVTGNNTNIDTVNVTDHSGDVISVDGDNTDISGVEANNNTGGTVVDVTGNDAEITDTAVKGGEGNAINVNGDNSNVNGVNITDYDGTGVSTNGTGAEIEGVTATGGIITVVDVTGDNASIKNVELYNVTGTGVKVNGTGAEIYSVNAEGGDVEVYDVSGGNTINPDITIDVTADTVPIHSDSTGNITISVSKDAAGTIHVTFNGKAYDFTLNGNSNVISFKDLAAGDYTVDVAYIPDTGSVYSSKNESATFHVQNWNFTELQALIDEAIQSGQNVTLEHDYVAEEGETAITVDAPITIDGNGYTIDANNQTGIFNITSDNVVIEDMDLTNAKDGAITADGNNITISGVHISNSTGTAISITGNDTTVSDVTIEDNDGVGIDIDGNCASVEDVELDNITQTAIAIAGDDANVDNVDLTEIGGEGINIAGDNSKINEVTAEHIDGTAIDVSGENTTITVVDLTDVDNGIVVEVDGKADIDDVTVKDTPGTALNVTADSAEVSDVNLTDVGKGAEITALTGDANVTDIKVDGADSDAVVVKAENGTATVTGADIKDVEDGTAVSVVAGSVDVSDVNMTNVDKGAEITANNGDVKVQEINVVNATDDAVTVKADNGTADVSGIGLTNITGDNGLKVESETAVVDDVTVNGGSGENAVSVETTGDAKISNVDMTNYNGTGVDAKSGEGNVDVANTTATGGEGTAVKVDAEKGNATVSGTELDNYTGKSVEVNAANATVTNTSISGGNATRPDVNSTETPAVVDPVVVSPDTAFDVPETGSSSPVFSIEMPKDATGQFIVKIDGKEVGRQNLTDGKASISVSGLDNGNHNVEVEYTGDANYAHISKSTSITVTRKDLTIAAGDAAYVINYGGVYSVTLSSKVAGQKVTFNINGQTVTATTDASGVAKITLTKAMLNSAGVKTITVKFDGDGDYNPATATAKITVNKEATKIAGKSVKKTYKKSKTKKIKITLKNSKNKAFKGKFKIVLKVNKKLKGKVGKKLKKGYAFTVKFNKKGVGIIKLTNKKVKGFKKGTYKFTVTYKGSALYKKATKKNIKMKVK